MNDIKGIPYSTAEFDKDGSVLTQPTVPSGTTDLIVVSHGWNNSRSDAEVLYTKLFSNFVDCTREDPAMSQRTIAINGIIWPSKRFDELVTLPGPSTNPAGGSASVGGGEDQPAAEATMLQAIDRMEPLFDDPSDPAQLQTLRRLVPELEHGSQAKGEFVATLRSLISPAGPGADVLHRDDGGDVFFEGLPDVIFERAGKHVSSHPGQAGTTGHAAGFGSISSKVANSVISLLNLTTYFEMKQRAGTVGKKGVAPLIDRLAGQVTRVHLVGHSFGGRVVTAAAANSATSKLHSMSLLQAAFSHNGFSKKRGGFFRDVVTKRRAAGPILITHTKNDLSVGIAYPTASRISGDNATGFGDADDEFGGIGSNGAQQMEPGEIFDETKELLAVSGNYEWKPGKFHNLESSNYIVDPNGGDAHGFVFVPEVAWAISRAILS